MYEIVVVGCVERTVSVALAGLVDAWRPSSGRFVLGVDDQARLVTLLNRLHDLGISIESIGRCATPP